MKYLLITCILAALSVTLVNGAHGIGKFLCVNGGADFDAEMERTMTVTCPMDVSGITEADMNIETEEQMLALMAKVMAYSYKCQFTKMKAVSEKGKLIPKKAEAYGDCFPAKHKKAVATKVAKCCTAHNPELKKESGKHAKTWEGFSRCMMDVLNMSPC